MAKGSYPVDKGRDLAFTAGSRPFYFSDLEDGLAKLKQRYFTEAVAAANQYFEFTDPIVLDGDYEIEIKAMFTTNEPPASQSLIAGREHRADTVSRLFMLYNNTSGHTTLVVPKTDDTFGYLSISQADSKSLVGKLFTAIIKKTGDSLLLTTGSFSVSYTSDKLSSVQVESLLARGSSFYADGTIADVKIWKGGDRNTGTLVVDCPIDGTGDVVENKAGTPYLIAHNFSAASRTRYMWNTDDNRWETANKAEITSTPVLGPLASPTFDYADIVDDNNIEPDQRWAISARVSALSPPSTGTGGIGWSGSTGIPASQPFRMSKPPVGTVFKGVYTTNSKALMRLFGRNDYQLSYDSISAKRVIEVA